MLEAATPAAQLTWIGLGAVALMIALWAVQVRTRDAGIVDVGWAASLALAAVLAATTGAGAPAVRMLIAVTGALWGTRLAMHLLMNRVLRGVEDGRYAMLREYAGAWQSPVLLGFFVLQAGFVAAFAVPFAIGATGPELTGMHVVGAALWLIGMVGEAVADRQLESFKADPANAGKTCRRGLWRYSRHPNYFFEWLIWCGFGALAWSAPNGWLGLTAPAFLLLLILFVTGIPPTEARALRTRGDDYRSYQRTTSAFVPWFPREENS